jgi:predicted MFS family arabinose efflux permease
MSEDRVKSWLGGIGEAFEDRNFRRYSLGSVLSWISYFVQAVAVAWTTWSLTHSTRWLAIVALLDALPNIALMPLGGVVADRFDRFRVLMASYGLAWLQALALTLLAFADALTIERLAALAFLHGAAHAFSIPAQYGFLPRFIDRRRLSSAISVSAAYTQLAVFAGPALGGWLILHYGVVVAYASNVVGYGVYFAFVAFLRTPAGYVQPPASGKSLLHDFLDGVKAIAAHRGILALLATMLLGAALWSAIAQMAPAIADKAMGSGVEGLSALLSAAGLGATVSALWLAHGGAARNSPRLVLTAFLGLVASVAGLALASSLLAGVLAMAALGGAYELCHTGSVALLQISIPDALRGRVMSTWFLLLRGAGAVGVVATGAVAEGWGLRAPLLVGAGLAAAAWVAAYSRRGQIAAAFEEM